MVAWYSYMTGRKDDTTVGRMASILLEMEHSAFESVYKILGVAARAHNMILYIGGDFLHVLLWRVLLEDFC